MALSTKLIKTRLRSIGNTKKITRAMEMVSAAKMRRAVSTTLATRSYAQTTAELVTALSQYIHEESHPLLRAGKGEQTLAILITANRGLAGSFNTNVITEAQKVVGDQARWVTVGRKGVESLARAQADLVADFHKADIINSVESVLPIVKLITAEYLTGKYKRVLVIYTDYISALTQKPHVEQLLPVIVAPNEAIQANETQIAFEPDSDTVLETILPRYLEIRLYQALLESNASEHSARMVTMKNATESAGDMIDELTLAFNQARQAAITREIAEIAGGKAALAA
ncbi:MAG: ATP synthase F1 subunit gamma [Candidatus Buchananbacteria bacterium]|nr:ATP synthase F1 subunit gamma [Candidatus Buchananbacteria bacterium]